MIVVIAVVVGPRRGVVGRRQRVGRIRLQRLGVRRGCRVGRSAVVVVVVVVGVVRILFCLTGRRSMATAVTTDPIAHGSRVVVVAGLVLVAGQRVVVVVVVRRWSTGTGVVVVVVVATSGGGGQGSKYTHHGGGSITDASSVRASYEEPRDRAGSTRNERRHTFSSCVDGIQWWLSQ